MPEGNLDSAVTSPPYNLPFSQDHNGSKGGLRGTTPSEDGAFTQYGTTPGQIEGMDGSEEAYNAAISSPPYAAARIDGNGDEGSSGLRNPDGSYVRGHDGWEKRKEMGGRYGNEPGNLANLPDTDLDVAIRGGAQADTGITSPPFEAVLSDRPSESIVAGGLRMGASSMGDGYGNTEGQVGNQSGDDFWMASRMILENLFYVLKPGAHAVFVLKAYVKDGKLENFPEKWVRLAEAVGFRLEHWHRAHVVEDKGTQLDLFGGEVHKTVERKSFFRRLAESKGSPRIDWEDVVCMKRP